MEQEARCPKVTHLSWGRLEVEGVDGPFKDAKAFVHHGHGLTPARDPIQRGTPCLLVRFHQRSGELLDLAGEPHHVGVKGALDPHEAVRGDPRN
jgi:hypothetical protein